MWETIKSLLLSSRAKSLYWRSGGMLGAGITGLFLDAATAHTLILPGWVVIGLGLVYGEITKYLNK